MKRVLLGAAVVLVAAFTVSRLLQRFREERSDKNVILMADWTEIQSLTARTSSMVSP